MPLFKTHTLANVGMAIPLGVVCYKVVDNFRKFVNNAWSGSQDDAERAVLSQLRSKMDSIVDDSVEQGLIKGNPEPLSH